MGVRSFSERFEFDCDGCDAALMGEDMRATSLADAFAEMRTHEWEVVRFQLTDLVYCPKCLKVYGDGKTKNS